MQCCSHHKRDPSSPEEKERHRWDSLFLRLLPLDLLLIHSNETVGAIFQSAYFLWIFHDLRLSCDTHHDSLSLYIITMKLIPGLWGRKVSRRSVSSCDEHHGPIFVSSEDSKKSTSTFGSRMSLPVFETSSNKASRSRQVGPLYWLLHHLHWTPGECLDCSWWKFSPSFSVLMLDAAADSKKSCRSLSHTSLNDRQHVLHTSIQCNSLFLTSA
jgi:hypothetical protein